MPTSMIIVDDFLDNAQALREASLRLTYPPQEGMFPGRNSVERIIIPSQTFADIVTVDQPVRYIL